MRDFNNQYYLKRVTEAAGFIAEKISFRPEVAVILGSGLGSLCDMIGGRIEIPYDMIPGYAEISDKPGMASNVRGHAGRLVSGKLSGKRVVAFNGRLHYYQGYDMHDVVLSIRILRMLGVDRLILTNAAGGINCSYKPGDIMLITDHIGLFCPSPLRGMDFRPYGGQPYPGGTIENDMTETSDKSDAFADMSEAYDRGLIAVAEKCAEREGLALKKGVYAFTRGPMYETPAEIEALKAMGADAVGMSTVPEAIAACSSGMKTLGISCITNMAAGKTGQRLSHEDVLATASLAGKSVSALIAAVIQEL